MRRTDARFLLGLLLLVLVCAAPGIGGPPVYDDGVAVLDNPKLRSPGRLLAGFLRPTPAVPPGVPAAWYPYRPLAEASLALNALVTGLRPAGLRMGTLLLHAVSTLVVFAFVRRLSAGLALPAAAFFALHPMAAQAVTYLSQRASVLEACLAFATLLLYWRGRETGRMGPAWITGLLAMMSKETGVTVPLLLAALEWIPGPRPGALKRWLPFAAMTLLPAAEALWAMKEHAPEPPGPGPLAYLGMETPIVLRYLGLAALPFPMRFHFDPVRPRRWASLLAGGLLAIAAAWSLFGPRRHALPRLGLALFLAPLALESTVFPIQGVGWCYRCYPSLLGAGLLFAWAVRRLAWVPLALLAVLAFGESRTWASVPALQARDVRSAFHLASAWATQGFRRLDSAQAARAERLFRRGLEAPLLDLKTAEGHATALLAMGRLEEARRETTALRRAFPRHLSPLWLEVRQALAEPDEGRLSRLEQEALSFPLLREELALWLSEREMNRGEWGKALGLLERHLEVFPSSAPLWDHLGWALLSTGRRKEAEHAYRRAVALEPGMPKAWFHLGLLVRDRDPAEAAAAFRRALALRADYAKAREALFALEGGRP